MADMQKCVHFAKSHGLVYESLNESHGPESALEANYNYNL